MGCSDFVASLDDVLGQFSCMIYNKQISEYPNSKWHHNIPSHVRYAAMVLLGKRGYTCSMSRLMFCRVFTTGCHFHIISHIVLHLWSFLASAVNTVDNQLKDACCTPNTVWQLQGKTGRLVQ